MRALLPLTLWLAACAPPDPEAPDPYAVPDGAPTGLYDPDARFLSFPDLAQTVVDDATATGLRVRLTDGARADLSAVLPSDFNLVDALEQLDGFGTTGGVILRFSSPVDPAAVADAARWVCVDDGAEVGFEAWSTDEGATVVLDPLFPLDPATAYAVVIPQGTTDAAGEAIWAAPALHAQLGGTGGPAHVRDAWAEALDALDLRADDVAHGTVFVTQSLFDQDEAVADLLRARAPRLVRSGDCVAEATITTCPATIEVADPLGEDRTIDADEDPAVQRTYVLSVDVHLPGDGSGGPFPVVMYGHGLAGDRGEARGVARDLAPEGVAVIAVDAPNHGDHPTVISPGELFQALEFFGVGVTDTSFDVLRLRDNFRLAAFDRLQVLQAVEAGFDADGDGTDDLDGAELHWIGHSLGGVMGPGLLTLAPEVRSAYLSVPGGRVSDIVARGETFAPLVALMAPPGTPRGEIDRFFPLLQAAIDRGEPANHATRFLASGRDAFLQQVLDDDIIPNACTRFLARAFGVELVGDVLQPVEGLAVHDGPFPVAGNVGGRTGALVQLDEMIDDDGIPVDATHSHVFGSRTNVALLRHWLRTAIDDDLGEALDPAAAAAP